MKKLPVWAYLTICSVCSVTGCQLFLPAGDDDGEGGGRTTSVSTTSSMGGAGGRDVTDVSSSDSTGAHSGPTSSSSDVSTGASQQTTGSMMETTSASSSDTSSSASSTGSGMTTMCTITWTVNDHTPGKYLGVGGVINRPFGQDSVATPFVDCMASSTADNTVACDVGILPKMTQLQLNLYNYGDAAGNNKENSRCDQPGFPTSDCPGTVTVECDGLPVVMAYVTNGTSVPAPPWGTTEANGYLELTVTTTMDP